MSTKRTYLSYFGVKEGKAIQALASKRDEILKRYINWAIRLHISPKQVTLFGFLIQLILFPLFFALKWYSLAFLVLFIHVVLDAFDGPLARAQKVDSNSGALADILSDTTGLVIVGLSMIFFGEIDYPGLVALYLVFHLYHTVFNIALNLYQRPLKFILHTKFFFFWLVLIKYLYNIDIIPIFLWISVIYMVINCLIAQVRIFGVLKEIDVSDKAAMNGK